MNRLLVTGIICSLLSAELQGQILLYDDHSIPVSGSVTALQFSPDNRFLACGKGNGDILIWDLDARKELRELRHGGPVNTIVFDSKSRYIVSGGDNRALIIWDLYSGDKIRTVTDYKGRISHIGISPDEQLLSVSGSRKEIYLVQFPSGELAGMLRNGHSKEVLFSAFDRTGSQLVSVGSDNQMIYWDTGNKRALRKSEMSPNTINASGIEIKTAGITPDLSKIIVAYTETKLAKGGRSMMFRYNTAIYDWQSGMLENIIEGNVKDIEDITVTPDGRYYITDNSTLRLKKINFWDVRTGEMVKNQQIDQDVSSISVSGHGDWMALAEKSGRGIRIYRLSGLGTVAQSLQVQSSPATSTTRQETNYTPSMQAGQVGLPQNTNVDIAGRYYALIIGINEYEDPSVNDLDAPIRDATALYSILTTSYSFSQEDITFLKNPTRAEIIDALDHLERAVTPNDNLLIFYAGHGHWDEEGHKGYWLPSDASYLSTANWFRNSSLTGYISSIRSKHTLLIADACFAGSIFKTRAAFNTTRAVARLYDMPSRKAMTSGTLKEVPDQSVFVRYLMKRLEENQEDYLPSEQLFFSLKTAVLNNSENVPQYGEVQNAGDEGGDFIFVRKKNP